MEPPVPPKLGLPAAPRNAGGPQPDAWGFARLHLEGGCWFSPLLRALPFPTGLVFPAELNAAVHTAHPRNSLGRRSPPKAWHRRLVSLPPRPVFLKEITACHPLPPRSPRPGAGLPGPPCRRAGQAGRAGRAGGGVRRAQASGVLPGCHFGWRRGVSLHSQQGEFPGTLPPPSALKGPAGRKEGEGKRAGKERGIRQHLPSGCGRGILTGGKIFGMEGKCYSPPRWCPANGAPGFPGAVRAHRGAWQGWSEGSREGEPSAHGNSQLGVGSPPTHPETLCVLSGGEETPLSPGRRDKVRCPWRDLSGARSVSQAPVTRRDRAGRRRGRVPTQRDAGRARGRDRRTFSTGKIRCS